ncbi:MAG: hypothetical protein COV91_05035 [Candidatus Taylorbacteria bacterium CG11_big_fil_rev_8_21_14_0_20_46_11]|uniref:Uncharacterized protein n=1 Tax=Candidatus Taylorbacteria bacterium CG11_big_fil_rev_8_21_14_0_20_46_11 TaxID=1975025 RepID=A0A2H0KCZ4_9BACT|nr:MAG: hypothetical protein COV91_05035 [Candidatus Taylorbacteria bacterium CG11_big_fil_rev_8_21_14_0_20_46_11]
MNDKKKKEKSIVSPFVNTNRLSKDDYYYDAMECLQGGKAGAKRALKMLETALKIDVDYVQTYIGLVSIYGALGEKKKVEETIKIAYEKTLKEFPKWPKKMEWGYLENRAYLRAIQYLADWYWDNRENEKAIELFRLLLKLNPNDNQGVRYEIAALYAGLNGKDVNRMTDEGNQKQDWSEQENLVSEQNKKHKFWKEPKY